MKILTAQDSDGNDLNPEQIKEDMPRLQQAYDKAKEEEPTWAFFGGVLEVRGHFYQVN